MQTALIVFHVILGVVLVILILLQGGSDELKGLGSSSIDSVMSPSSSATLMTKLTTTLAGLFIINCLIMANIYSRNSRASIADEILEQQKQAESKAEHGAPLAK
jgi:preprotein translocase subunit SecG